MRPAVLVVVLLACERVDSTPPCKCEQPPAADARVTPSKRATLDKLLAQGPVLLRLDARKPGVIVPAKYRTDEKLVLRIGKELAPPIPDLAIDDRGITATLSFEGAPSRCVIPWPSLYGLQLDLPRDEQLWREDIPPDIKP